MSMPRSTYLCPHYQGWGPYICGTCIVAAEVGYMSTTSLQNEALERYLRAEATRSQQNRDQQVLHAQRPRPYSIGSGDRSVANSLVGASNSTQLPSYYPYATELEIDESSTGARPTSEQQRRAMNAPPRQQQRRTPYNDQSLLPSSRIPQSTRYGANTPTATANDSLGASARPSPARAFRQYRGKDEGD